jgi:subtilisin family serine protease
VIDGGFTHTDVTAPLSHLYTNDKIIKTWDFVQNEENVYAHNTHGTHVLSNICGFHDSVKLGFATKATFLLARSETRSELAFEEDYWLFAMEWGHKNGAHIINSSLGYTNSRYFNEDMDGKTSLVSKAANIAASKGILVVNAMGNEGSDRWKYLSTPADADSALAIGGIDPGTSVRVDFSSVGPTWDKRQKPNVSAPAITIVSGKNSYTKAYGTSFATPLVTGFAACVWEMIPELTNMELFRLIEKSGSLYPYYDYAHGYGIPQAGYFLSFERKKKKKSFEHSSSDGQITITPIEFNSKTPHLFYHIKNKNGELISYYLYELDSTSKLVIDTSDFKENYSIQVFYNGYTEEIKPIYE